MLDWIGRLRFGLVIDESISRNSTSLRFHSCFQARKRHVNIDFLVRCCPWDDPRFVPGQAHFVPGSRDKPGLSLLGQTQDFSLVYTLEAKPSLSQGQTQFVPRTNRRRRVAEKAYVLKSLCAFFAHYFCASICDGASSISKFGLEPGFWEHFAGFLP